MPDLLLGDKLVATVFLREHNSQRKGSVLDGAVEVAMRPGGHSLGLVVVVHHGELGFALLGPNHVAAHLGIWEIIKYYF